MGEQVRIISAAEIEGALDNPALIEALREGFRGGVEAPPRHHHTIPTFGSDSATLLIMPAWRTGRFIGVKVVTVFPDNAERSLPSIMGVFMLIDGRTGKPAALLDGALLTLKRTAAASALATSYLARADARRLLMVGTGALAPYLVEAHATVRAIGEILVWGRDPAKAAALARRLKRRGVRVDFTQDLEAAVRGADIVSCATMAREPLIRGEWLAPGTHLDLVGAFKPDMRESDDETMRRGRVFVDTRDGCLGEAGDIIQAIDNGVLSADDIAADLFELARGDKAGRRYYDQITVFKSVGTAIEDLSAAQLAYRRA